MSSLFVIHGNSQGQRFLLPETGCVVGRDISCEICLPDTEISRRHAKLTCVPASQGGDVTLRWVITDLNSSNGTYVNGKQLSAAQTLSPGDSVQMGGTLMLFTQESAAALDDIISPGPVEQGGRSAAVRHPERQHAGPQHPAGRSAADAKLEVTMATSAGGAKILRAISHTEGQDFMTGARRFTSPAAPWAARAEGYLQLLYEMTLAVSHCMDTGRLADELLELVFQWIDADRGCILLFDQATTRLEPRAKRVRDTETAGQRMIISKTILDYVLENKKGVLTSDATQDDRWSSAASVVTLGIREVICVPLQGRYGVVGAIYLDTYSPPDIITNPSQQTHRFGEDHLKLMITIAHHTALAIEDTRYYSANLQAERLAAVGQTVATISHHVKNILQGIRGGSYLIEMGLGEHNEQLVSRGWKIVDRNQNRISALVMDMLTLSKERKPEVVPCDLNRVVGEVAEMMLSHALQADVLLVWRPDLQIPQMRFDPEGIHHAVLNLITNAIDAAAEMLDTDGGHLSGVLKEGPEKTVRREALADYVEQAIALQEEADEKESHGGGESVFSDGSHIFDEDDPAGHTLEYDHQASQSGVGDMFVPRGQVDVETRWVPQEGTVQIIVKDTGPGISPEQVAHVFQAFESSKGNRGTGLGLPVCKKIITEHGGTIRVEQRLPHGCRFIITLPAETDGK